MAPGLNTFRKNGEVAKSRRESTDLEIKEETHTSAEVLRNLIPGWFPQIFVPNCLSRSKAQSLKISHAVMHRQMFVSVAAVGWKETALKICVICRVLAATSDNSSAAVSDGFQDGWFCFCRRRQATSGRVVQCNDGPDAPGWPRIGAKS